MGNEHIGNVGVNADELLHAYEEGKSTEDLNLMLSGMEDNLSGEVKDEGGEPEKSEVFSEHEEENAENAEEKMTEGGEKAEPFKSFKTREDYQKDFDRLFNRRHKKLLESGEKREAELFSIKKNIAELLGVSEEDAERELEERLLTVKAEREGKDSEAYINEFRKEKEIKELKEELKERERQDALNVVISDISSQGKELESEFSGFDLDGAMENDEFRETVFSLYRISPKTAVRRAFFASGGLGLLKREQEPKRTVTEGAARAKSGAHIKKASVADMSGKEILELEKRILRGERIEL